MHILPIGPMTFITLARLASVPFEVSSPQIIQILKSTRSLKIDIASMTPTTPVWNLRPIIFSSKRHTTMSTCTTMHRHDYFISEFLIILQNH